MKEISLDIQALTALYRSNEITPAEVISEIKQRVETHKSNPIWIHVLSDAELAPYVDALKDKSPEELPLYGIPFAIKDNIDLADVPTTAACAEYAYTPSESAFVVSRLIEAGAIPIGKTNLDQFATGLVGVRSPYGACQNSFDPDYLSGGSSAGSAVAVALGLVSFSLGTDTAGSGRVPASLNNLIGLKPTRGVLSTQGVVPACRSLDCVSIFSLCSADADQVLEIASSYDETDPYSRDYDASQKGLNDRFTFGVLSPESRQFFGNKEAESLYEQSIERMQSIGGEAVMVDYEPFNEAALLLYEGPWVAERYAAVGAFIEAHRDAVFPVTGDIICGGASYQAADAFSAFYRLQALKKKVDAIMRSFDFLMLPTNGTIYKISDVEAEPIALNSNFGYYTNFMNLLDFAGLAIPSGFYPNKMPFGVTLVADVFHDDYLLKVASRFEKASQLKMGATDFVAPGHEVKGSSKEISDTMLIAVCGAHMTDLPLNHQLTDLGGTFIEATQTAAAYRFYALTDKDPIRPGLVRADNGESIDLEIWSLPKANVGSFLAQIASPLGLGKLELIDGREVTGFLCEQIGVKNATDITALRSWRSYLAQA